MSHWFEGLEPFGKRWMTHTSLYKSPWWTFKSKCDDRCGVVAPVSPPDQTAVTQPWWVLSIKPVFKASIIIIFRAVSGHLGVLNLYRGGLVLLLILLRQTQLVNKWRTQWSIRQQKNQKVPSGLGWEQQGAKRDWILDLNSLSWHPQRL